MSAALTGAGPGRRRDRRLAGPGRRLPRRRRLLLRAGEDPGPLQARAPGATREGLQEIAEQFSLSALDGAACKLGVSRETLARALATPEARERFAKRYEIDDAEAGARRSAPACCGRSTTPKKPAPSARSSPCRCAATLEQIPLDQAIELINNAELPARQRADLPRPRREACSNSSSPEAPAATG